MLLLSFYEDQKVAFDLKYILIPSIKKFPFVNTKELSYLERSEEELLFSMISVFRFLQIGKQNDFYRVQLTRSDDVDEQLANYTTFTREETRSSHSLLILIYLILFVICSV
jgi:hypothetical protein